MRRTNFSASGCGLRGLGLKLVPEEGGGGGGVGQPYIRFTGVCGWIGSRF